LEVGGKVTMKLRIHRGVLVRRKKQERRESRRSAPEALGIKRGQTKAG
jgi:hypothetical protein